MKLTTILYVISIADRIANAVATPSRGDLVPNSASQLLSEWRNSRDFIDTLLRDDFVCKPLFSLGCGLENKLTNKPRLRVADLYAPQPTTDLVTMFQMAVREDPRSPQVMQRLVTARADEGAAATSLLALPENSAPAAREVFVNRQQEAQRAAAAAFEELKAIAASYLERATRS
jgi:hypothetical protein